MPAKKAVKQTLYTVTKSFCYTNAKGDDVIIRRTKTPIKLDKDALELGAKVKAIKEV